MSSLYTGVALAERAPELSLAVIAADPDRAVHPLTGSDHDATAAHSSSSTVAEVQCVPDLAVAAAPALGTGGPGVWQGVCDFGATDAAAALAQLQQGVLKVSEVCDTLLITGVWKCQHHL